MKIEARIDDILHNRVSNETYNYMKLSILALFDEYKKEYAEGCVPGEKDTSESDYMYYTPWNKCRAQTLKNIRGE